MNALKHVLIRRKNKVTAGALGSAFLVAGAAFVYSTQNDVVTGLHTHAHDMPSSLQAWLTGVAVEPSLLAAWSDTFKSNGALDDDSIEWRAACVNAPPPPAHEVRTKAWLERLQLGIYTREYHVHGEDKDAAQEDDQFAEVLPVLQNLLAVAPHWPPRTGDHFVIRTLGENARVNVDDIASIMWQRDEERLANVVRMPDIQGGFSLYQKDGMPWRKDLFVERPLAQNFPVVTRFSMAHKDPVTGRVQPHTGVDFLTPVGTPLIAQADGRVAHAGRTRSKGYYLVVEYLGGIEASYLHLSRFAPHIETGAPVSKGQVIAHTGNTGLTSSPHLHYELKVAGVKVDPMRAALPIDYTIAPMLEGDFEKYLAMLSHDDRKHGMPTIMRESLDGEMLAASESIMHGSDVSP